MLDDIFKAVNKMLSPEEANQALTIPHPEEPMSPGATLTNTNFAATLLQWLIIWEVPQQYWEHWKTTIVPHVYEVYPDSILAMGVKPETPSATWEADGKRHIVIKPPWINPGVIAHEQSHNSYAYLNPGQKAEFSTVFTPLKTNDPLIRFLFTRNTYGLTSDVEGHAEVYRYIGQKMPPQLKQYYPKLF